jgi:hypothetical protein
VIRAGTAAAVLLAFALTACSDSDRVYDASVATLAARVEHVPGNYAFQLALDGRLATLPPDATKQISAQLDALHLVPLRFPGLLFETHPQSGAGLADVEEWLARPVPMAKVDEVGTVEANAAKVAIAIGELARDGRRVVIFSASKGSADVRYALETDAAAASRTAAWIDLVGVLEGTPLTEPESVARWSSREWLPAATADSMSESVRRKGPPRVFPPNVRAVHFAAFPSAAAIGPDARAAFGFLRTLGPTDGYVMLESYLRAPGRVVVMRGADHYLRTPDTPRRVAAALLAVLHEIALERPAEGR